MKTKRLGVSFESIRKVNPQFGRDEPYKEITNLEKVVSSGQIKACHVEMFEHIASDLELEQEPV